MNMKRTNAILILHDGKYHWVTSASYSNRSWESKKDEKAMRFSSFEVADEIAKCMALNGVIAFAVRIPAGWEFVEPGWGE